MCRPHAYRAAIALGFVMLAGLLFAAEPWRPVAHSAAAPNSTVTSGVLSNGFRYAIFPRALEPGRISIRLVVHAGSLDEREDELGYAHFVEHMAFNGTRRFPPGKLIPFFQKLGVSWSADVNAGTTFGSTTYKIDLPTGSEGTLQQMLEVFSDFGDGIAFSAAEVRRERGVILSELEAIDSMNLQQKIAHINVLYSGTLIPQRLPLGKPDSVRRTEATGLRRFYDRCYRPDRMTLIVVGDVEPSSVDSLIRKGFGPLKARGSRTPPVAPGDLKDPNFSAHVIPEPFATAATVTLASVQRIDADPAASVDLRIVTDVLLNVFEQRLKARRAVDAQTIGEAKVVRTSGIDERFRHIGLQVHARSDRWVAATNVLESEFRRAREQGFHSAEVQEAVAAYLAGLRADVSRFAALRAEEFAEQIADVVASGCMFELPSDRLARAEVLLPGFGPKEAAEALARILPDRSLRLILTTPAPPDGGPDALLAAYRANASVPFAAQERRTAEALSFRYTNFGKPGEVAKRWSDESVGIESVRFENGVKVNLRPSKTEPGRFRLAVRLGQGFADVPKDRPGMAVMGIALLSRCDLGRHTREELSRLHLINGLEGNWSFDSNNVTVFLQGPLDVLPYALQSVAAVFSDTKLDEAKMQEARAWYAALTRSMLSSTAEYGRAESLWRASGDDSRFQIPSPATANAYSFEEIAAWVRSRFLNGPMEIGLTGDFDTEKTIAAVAATLGTLSKRNAATPPAEPLVLRKGTYRHLSFIELPDKAAAVRVYWPSAELGKLKTRRALTVAIAALQERIRQKLREELGVTYAPLEFMYVNPMQQDFGFVGIELTFEPDKALSLAERALKLAGEFVAKGISEAEFERIRKPLRISANAELQSNEWWLNEVLQWAQTSPEVVEEARTHASGIDELDCAVVNRLAAVHLAATTANCAGFIPRRGSR